ncbi:LPS export ABC transporter periplasmic protein LptC [Flavobacterium psychrophilum]|nr:LPS export ABC transporter periplasmic protein LptC [Flavobacterium psychrophilum]MEB3395886.1 LPS export ABC transporter periplasmic protein LptC [Flavobacterium psychrophilum]MEB3441960.1 LPS export ABC transporter periplasmic protein LptC [Flavobacterium psychrophilum]
MLLLIVTTLFFISCESNINEFRKINVVEFNPIGEAKDFNLKYTDSGKIKVVLVSPQMLDFSQLDFPFTEFPKGIKVTIYDTQGNKSFVTSNYAISYTNSNLIDLSGKVKITTNDGKILETEQLYYDQKNEWFFTQKSYKFTNKGSVIEGLGIDFSKDFKVLDTQSITGVYSI